MTDAIRTKILQQLGATASDMEGLLEYTRNVFKPKNDSGENDLSKWHDKWEKVQAFCQATPRLEMFDSIAGIIPIVYPACKGDFESLMRDLVYKGKTVPSLEGVGAQFVFSNTLRFIILSSKPYSGITAKEMLLSEKEWIDKSMIIRKYHECAHYYTKRFLGSSRNNLHDELISDFCGIFGAFGIYCAEWFIKFYDRRAHIYTRGLSENAANVVRELAKAASISIEAWTKTENFANLSESERVDYLASKELLVAAIQGIN